MDKVIKNYEEPLAKPMTTKQYFKFLKHKRSVKKMNKRLSKHKHNNDTPSCGHDHSKDSQPNIPPQDIKIVSFAIVIDDVVVDVIHVQDSLGYFLQKNPKFIEIEKNRHLPHQGWVYKDDEFVPFEQVVSQITPTSRG